MIKSINPTTEKVLAEFRPSTKKQVEEKLRKATRAFDAWRKTPFHKRERLMHKLAADLRKNKQALGEMLTKEMGKPIGQAVAEIEKCASVCDYYADHAEQMLAAEQVITEAEKSYVRFDPLGVILAVMPWNFPFWQVIRFAAPGLMAGNVGLLKHASNVPQSALAIEKAFKEAGFPAGVFQTVLISSSRVESLLRDKRIAAATLTGSENAGRSVARIAGDEIKPTILELGGSDPFIVLKDADLQFSCSIAVSARLQNNGQSCIAAKRFIVVKERHAEFIELLKARFESLIVGDPLNPETDVGPLATRQMRDDIVRQVDASVQQGARLVTGGTAPKRAGYFYQPTILAAIKKGMPGFDEELFGPVASIISAKDEKDAIRLANASRFGLGASIWTTDLKRAEKLIPQIEAGAVFVNGMVKSDPRLPFGGIKKSGYGRELGSYGIKEFINIKTVWIEKQPQAANLATAAE